MQLKFHTRHVFTISQCSEGLHTSSIYNITLFRHTSYNYYFLLHLSGQDVYTGHANMTSHCSDTRHSITTSYYISVIRTSTHVMHLQYHTVQTHVIQLLLLTTSSGQDVNTRHAFTISHCSDTRHSVTTSYYISVIRTSTHIMHLLYHTVQTDVIQLLLLTTSQWPGRLNRPCNYDITLFRLTSLNYYFLLHLTDKDVYTRQAFTISHCSDRRHSITPSYYISVARTSTQVMQL
jgi:hypothetical protein